MFSTMKRGVFLFGVVFVFHFVVIIDSQEVANIVHTAFRQYYLVLTSCRFIVQYQNQEFDVHTMCVIILLLYVILLHM